MKLSDIHIRDPFILLEGEKYYMYGTRGAETWGFGYGLDVYVSEDLEDWSEAIEVFTPPKGFWADKNYWAPEVHKYHGRYYMFVSFKCDAECRGTQILAADSPLGPFLPHSSRPVTPRDWECLDGTLYVDKNDVPYMIFCHEWVQTVDGEMCAVQLSEDLTEAVGEPILLFKASEPSWALKETDKWVTDGPYVYSSSENEIILIWASIAKDGYCEAIARCDSNDLRGNWSHDEELLFKKDGGHGMIFKTKDGKLNFTFHQPNGTPFERPKIVEVEEREGRLVVV